MASAYLCLRYNVETLQIEQVQINSSKSLTITDASTRWLTVRETWGRTYHHAKSTMADMLRSDPELVHLAPRIR
jgi:hypothetical protein